MDTDLVTRAQHGDEEASRYHQGPGRIDEVWILDVNGELNVFDAGYYEGTPTEHVDELHAILESMTFSQTTYVERRIHRPSCKADVRVSRRGLNARPAATPIPT